MLHGVPLFIISDRDSRFTSWFWLIKQKALGTQINLSKTYHPQTDGQTERTTQTMQDMLQACAIKFKGNWDTHFPLIYFSHNNNYHIRIQCSSYQALCGRKWCSPFYRFEIKDRQLTRLDLIQETIDKISIIKYRLKISRDHQKSYAENYRKPL